MRTLTKLSLLATLPLVLLGFAPRSWADVIIPVDQVVTEIRQQTQIPIYIPGVIPDMEGLYVNVDVSAEGYYVNFDFTQTCNGSTACNFGGAWAQRNGELMNAEDMGLYDTLETVELAGGLEGQFANTCGSYCIATVQWQSNGVLYGVNIKNGRMEEVLALANAAIEAGPRGIATRTGGATR